MHRSGTSVVARLANLLGVCLGPERRLVKAAPDNPRGFWEHRGIFQINQRLLSRAGGSWKQVPNFEPGWQLAPELADLKGRARAVLDELAAAHIWGFKDPRTCLTLPFWQHLIGPMRYLICVRRPLAVARSLQRRDGLALEKGVHLWLTHLELALEHTREQRRTFVIYESLMRDFRPQLARIANLLDQPELAAREGVQRDVATFIDPTLQHSDAHVEGPVSEWLELAERVYEGLERGTEVSAPLRAALRLLGPEVERLEGLEHASWLQERERITRDIGQMVPAGDALILVDDGQWALDPVALGRCHFPFLEREGTYWGPPPDDASAIVELERLRRLGVKFVAFGAPSFWWLDHYADFHTYLRSQSRSVAERPQLVVFELARVSQP
jgi:hypothetical protein